MFFKELNKCELIAWFFKVFSTLPVWARELVYKRKGLGIWKLKYSFSLRSSNFWFLVAKVVFGTKLLTFSA